MKAWTLLLVFLCHPHYSILLCADSVLPPSPWTDEFRVEVDRKHKVIRLSGDFT